MSLISSSVATGIQTTDFQRRTKENTGKKSSFQRSDARRFVFVVVAFEERIFLFRVEHPFLEKVQNENFNFSITTHPKAHLLFNNEKITCTHICFFPFPAQFMHHSSSTSELHSEHTRRRRHRRNYFLLLFCFISLEKGTFRHENIMLSYHMCCVCVLFS